MDESTLLLVLYIVAAATLTMFIVPFVLAPMGWARRVDKPESYAAKVLDKKLNAAADRVAEQVGKKLGDLDAQKQRIEGALKELASSIPGKDGTININADPFGAMFDERLQAFLPVLGTLIDQKLANHKKGGQMRGDGGGGATTAIEVAMEEGVWAAENPQQAEALAMAHQFIDGPGGMIFNWDDKKKKLLHQQAMDLAMQGGNVKAFIDRLQGATLVQGGGAQAGRKGAGPAQF